MTTDESTEPAPLVCDMSTATDNPQERMGEYGRLFEQSLAARDRSAAGLTFRFRGNPGVEAWVRDLSRRESECCSFFTYDISVDDAGDVAWTIASDGNPVAESILDEMYRLPDTVGDGLPGLMQQLNRAGLTIRTSDDGRVTSVF